MEEDGSREASSQKDLRPHKRPLNLGGGRGIKAARMYGYEEVSHASLNKVVRLDHTWRSMVSPSSRLV
jgi:hypothetical protein